MFRHLFGLCWFIIVIGSDDIACDSEFECANDTLTTTSNLIECRGYGSCPFASIQNDGTKATRCSGRSSCQHAKSFKGSSTFAANLYGYYALAWGKYVNITDDIVNCLGEATCYNIATLYVNSWSCYGIASCANYNRNPINDNLNSMSKIKGYAMLSNMNSILNSSRSHTLLMDGAFAGYNTTIVCQAGLTCSLECTTSGCIGLTFICDENALDCTISCDDQTNICPTNGNQTAVLQWIDMIAQHDVKEGYFMSYFEKEYPNTLFDLSSECNVACNNFSACSFQNLPQDLGM